MVIPEAATSVNEVPGTVRKRRVVYLFIIVMLETFTGWLLT